MRTAFPNLPPFPPAPTSRIADPSVSVVVVNHNYGRYLRAAVDSALSQRDVTVDVVVVDDGSTDCSRRLLSGYDSRVRAVLQPNLGQSAAFNAGMAAAAGNVVLFLDADDTLHPQVAARVADIFRRDLTIVRVVYRLAIVDEAGNATGKLTPPHEAALPTGDLRCQILGYADDLVWPPTSGNAFAAWALHRVLPLPVSSDRVGADSWLHATIPLLGHVAALDEVGGCYRAHGANHAFRQHFDVRRSQRIIARAAQVHPRVQELAVELGYPGEPPCSVTLAAHRMVSLRVAESEHPIAGDDRVHVLRDGLVAAYRRSDVNLGRKLVYMTWFFVAAFVPTSLVRVLAENFFMPERRPSLLRRMVRG